MDHNIHIFSLVHLSTLSPPLVCMTSRFHSSLMRPWRPPQISSGTRQGTDKQNRCNHGLVSTQAAQLPVLSVVWPTPPSAALPPAAWLPLAAGLSGPPPQPFFSPAPAVPWLSSLSPAEKVPELENQKGPLSTETERILVHRHDLWNPSPIDPASVQRCIATERQSSEEPQVRER